MEGPPGVSSSLQPLCRRMKRVWLCGGSGGASAGRLAFLLLLLKQVCAPLGEPGPPSGQCLLLVSSAPELDRPFWGWLEPEPRPYNLPQYLASSMLSSKKS